MEFITPNMLFVLIFGGLTVESIRTGTAYFPPGSRPIQRKLAPLAYWGSIGVTILMFGIAMLFAVGDYRRATSPAPAVEIMDIPERSDGDLLGLATSFQVDDRHEIVRFGDGQWAVRDEAGRSLGEDLEWHVAATPRGISRSEAFARYDAWVARNR